MPLSKSTGNMYPWVTHMHTHLAGECPHKCKYCYVQSPPASWGGRYKGPIRLVEKEFDVKYPIGSTVFIEHCTDLFTAPRHMIYAVLGHCSAYPGNAYVFQTKRPEGYLACLGALPNAPVPTKSILGCTIETNRLMLDISNAPAAAVRAIDMMTLAKLGYETFITIEPILAFDLDDFVAMIVGAKPGFVNIGADSKKHGLEEPTKEEVLELARQLGAAGIEVRAKRNLDRLTKGDGE